MLAARPFGHRWISMQGRMSRASFQEVPGVLVRQHIIPGCSAVQAIRYSKGQKLRGRRKRKAASLLHIIVLNRQEKILRVAA